MLQLNEQGNKFLNNKIELMNINNSKAANNEIQHDAGICQTSSGSSDHELMNSFKCNQRPFSSADLWNIQKQKRKLTVGSNFTIL
jgi:hypothetical protein